MQFPIILLRNKVLIVARRDDSNPVGRLDEKAGLVDMNVAGDGGAHLEWIIDADGAFTALSSEGVLPGGLLELLRLRRRRERYRMHDTRDITVGELSLFVVNLKDPYPEAPHASDLQAHLSRLRSEEIIDRNNLRGYLGE